MCLAGKGTLFITDYFVAQVEGAASLSVPGNAGPQPALSCRLSSLCLHLSSGMSGLLLLSRLYSQIKFQEGTDLICFPRAPGRCWGMFVESQMTLDKRFHPASPALGSLVD